MVCIRLWDFFSPAPFVFEVLPSPSPLHAGVEDLGAVAGWAGDAAVDIVPDEWPAVDGLGHWTWRCHCGGVWVCGRCMEWSRVCCSYKGIQGLTRCLENSDIE